MEIWRDINGYEGKYQISNIGNVKSLNYRNHRYAQNLVPKVNNRGYLFVELAKNGKRKCMQIHRLVAEAFLENPSNFPIVNHIDEDPQNNNKDNLEWCDFSYNMRYSKNLHPEKKYRKRGIPYSRNERIAQFDVNGKQIKIWNSTIEIKSLLGYHTTSIFECCSGKRKTAYGYKWGFAN